AKKFSAYVTWGDKAPLIQGLPGPYYHLAADGKGPFQASRYIQKLQARRSPLVWKIYGRRTDGWSNDDFPHETVLGDPKSLRWHGHPVKDVDYNNVNELRAYLREHGHQAFVGKAMPPPEAVAGTYQGPDGKPIKVPSLSDEDRRTIVRWIDLGCPIDLDPAYDPKAAQPHSYGWMGDDQRPTLTLTYPEPGPNASLSRILVGMADAYTGLNLDTFDVRADFPVDGVPAGQNLSKRFTLKTQGVWELALKHPVGDLPKGKLTVSVKDRQGNLSRIERTFSVGSRTRP